MNPDKLFDYLDGRLSLADRDELEARLATDAHLQRQLAIAREIHRGMPHSGEVISGPSDQIEAERGGVIGRRILLAAVLLIVLNVALGMFFIATSQTKKREAAAKERSMREQLALSLGAAAETALPPPTFTAGEIALTAPRATWEDVAARVTAAAEAAGGSAVKGLAEENVMTVLADVPVSRAGEFRAAVSSGAAAPEAPAAAAPLGESAATDSDDRTIFTVRITEAR